MANFDDYTLRDVAKRLAAARAQITDRTSRIKADTNQLVLDTALANELSRELESRLKKRGCLDSYNNGFVDRLEALICELVSG